MARGLGIDPARVGAAAAVAAPPRSPIHAGLKPTSAGALVKYTLIAVVGGLSAVSANSEAEPAAAPLELRQPQQLAPEAVSSAPLELRAPVVDSRPTQPARTSPEPRVWARRVESARGSLARDRAASAPPPAAHVPSPSQGVIDPLLLEVQQLDRVRAALGAGRSLAALGELDAYDARFPRGELTLEAAVLRVRALTRAGRFAIAARLARSALELPGSERYRSELGRRVDGEDDVDKLGSASTLKEPR